MYASKENAARVANIVESWAAAGQRTADVDFVLTFIEQARKKLPSEESYQRDSGRRVKVKPMRTK